jgi:Tfp pilus assembly protein PilF
MSQPRSSRFKMRNADRLAAGIPVVRAGVTRGLAVIGLAIAILATGCDEHGVGSPATRRQAAPGDSTGQADSAAAQQPAARDAAPVPTGPPDIRLDRTLSGFFDLITREQRYGAARVRLRNYLNDHPESGRAEFLFGLSYHKELNHEQALVHFERAIELEPTYHPTYHFLGWCRYYLGDPPRARQAFETHLRHVEAPDSQFGLGVICLDEGDLNAAEQRLRRAIELQPDEAGSAKGVAKARARLADVYAQRGEFDLARAELEASIRLYPDHVDAHYKLYRVLLRLSRSEEANTALAAYEAARMRVHGAPDRTMFPE